MIFSSFLVFSPYQASLRGYSWLCAEKSLPASSGPYGMSEMEFGSPEFKKNVPSTVLAQDPIEMSFKAQRNTTVTLGTLLVSAWS